jgi:hypothetical protein
MPLFRFFMLLSLVVWIGGIVFFAAVVAPAVFSVLPTRHLAGLVVNRSLILLHWIGVVSGGVFLVSSLFHSYLAYGNARPLAVRNLLLACMLGLTLVSQVVVAPRMAALRAEMGEIDLVAVSDPRRVEFNRLHQWSTRLEGGVPGGALRNRPRVGDSGCAGGCGKALSGGKPAFIFCLKGTHSPENRPLPHRVLSSS